MRSLVSGILNFIATHYKTNLVAPFELMKPRCRIGVLGLQVKNWVWPISVWAGRWTWLRNGDILMKSSARKWPIGVGEFVNALPTKQLWLKGFIQSCHFWFLDIVLFRFSGIYPVWLLCLGANRPNSMHISVWHNHITEDYRSHKHTGWLGVRLRF